MQVKRRLAAATVALVFAAAAFTRPAPARADTEEAFILAGVGVGAYLIFLVVATSLVYGDKTREFAPPSSTPGNHGGLDRILTRYGEPDRAVRFGARCSQFGGSVTLACW